MPPAAPGVGAGAAPAPPVAPRSPAKPGEFFKSMSHSFLGAMFNAISGGEDKVVGYDTDAAGKMTPRVEKMTAGDRVSRIIRASMAGLAAGANAPDRPGAEALSGLGAGFAGATAQQEAAVNKMKGEAKEEFTRKRQQELDQASIANANALTYSHWQHAMQEGLDHDPERKMYQGIVDSAQAAGVPIRFVNGDELTQMTQDDPTFLKTHIALPLGASPMIHDGKTVMNPDGSPKMVGKIALLDGSSEGDRKLQLSSAFVSDIQKYGKPAGFSESDIAKLNTDLSVPMSSFVSLFEKIQEAKKKALATPFEPVMVGDKLQMYNPFSNEMKEPNEAQRLQHEKDVTDIEYKKAETKKALAGAAKEKGETADRKLLESGLVGEDFLKTLPTADQAQVRAVGEGRQDMSVGQLRTKDGQRLSKLVNQAYPDYDFTKAPAYGKARIAFTSGKEGAGINSFNTVLSHLSRMYDHTTFYGTVPGVKNIARAFGNESAAALNSDRQAVAEELARAYKAGVASEGEIKEWNSKLDVASPVELKNNIKEISELLMGKLDAYKNQWASAIPRPGIVSPLPIISPVGRAAYEQITGKTLERDVRPQTGQGSSGVPAEASHVYKDANGNVVGYALNGKYVALGSK